MKSQTGLVFLSVSIVLASVIVAYSITRNAHINKNAPQFGAHDTRIAAVPGAASIPLNVNTNGNDVTYYTELKVGGGKSLLIVPANDNKAVRIEGRNINAKFFHVSRLLEIEYGDEKGVRFVYFNNPVSWKDVE